MAAAEARSGYLIRAKCVHDATIVLEASLLSGRFYRFIFLYFSALWAFSGQTLFFMKAKLKRLTQRTLKRSNFELVKKPRVLLDRPRAELQITLDILAQSVAYFNGGELNFVQVGAYDGVMFDPLRHLILQHGWRGILLEPQPDQFARLRENYRDQPQLILKNAAIDERDGPKILYRARDDYFANFQRAGELEWVKSAASFERAALEGIPHIDGYIEEVPVEGISFDTLFEQTDLGHVHLLQIDTEGFDYEIIKMFDIARRRPEIVHFEHKMLSERDLNQCLKMLVKQGYLLTQIGGEDTLVYLPPKNS